MIEENATIFRKCIQSMESHIPASPRVHNHTHSHRNRHTFCRLARIISLRFNKAHFHLLARCSNSNWYLLQSKHMETPKHLAGIGLVAKLTALDHTETISPTDVPDFIRQLCTNIDDISSLFIFYFIQAHSFTFRFIPIDQRPIGIHSKCCDSKLRLPALCPVRSIQGAREIWRSTKVNRKLGLIPEASAVCRSMWLERYSSTVQLNCYAFLVWLRIRTYMWTILIALSMPTDQLFLWAKSVEPYTLERLTSRICFFISRHLSSPVFFCRPFFVRVCMWIALRLFSIAYDFNWHLSINGSMSLRPERAYARIWKVDGRR